MQRTALGLKQQGAAKHWGPATRDQRERVRGQQSAERAAKGAHTSVLAGSDGRSKGCGARAHAVDAGNLSHSQRHASVIRHHDSMGSNHTQPRRRAIQLERIRGKQTRFRGVTDREFVLLARLQSCAKRKHGRVGSHSARYRLRISWGPSRKRS